MDTIPEVKTKEICEWLRCQLRYFEASGVVVGVDGSVGAIAAAALASKALGPNVLCLLTSFQSSHADCSEALKLVEHLGLRHELISLDKAYELLVSCLPMTDPQAGGEVRARLRMTALYHYAALHGYAVLGTLDRSDWEIGYFTRHGDGSGDIFPVLHLLKTDVLNLLQYLQIPDHLLPPSSSIHLRAEKTGVGEPGFGYLELDAYLSGDFKRVPNAIQQSIRTMQQGAFPKKRTASRFTMTDGASDNDSPFVDGHEAYDRSIEALTIISRAITSDQYLEDILRLIVMVTAEVMSSSVCSLWLLDDKEGVLRLRATQSIDREYLKDRVLKVGEGVVGKVVADNRPYVVPDVLQDPLFKEKVLARRMGLVSMLSMPMRVKDRVIGVINCYTSHPHAFSDLQMNVLTAVANQAAVAIEKTELIVQTKVIQEELERRKIIERAKDLLMKRFSLSGEEAFRWLQKRSMNTRKSMREVSEAVLLTMEG